MMRSLAATLVDTHALLKTVVASFGIGIAFALAFALAVYGSVRFADHSRDDRTLAAGVAGVLAVLGAAVCIGAIVLGIVVMIKK